MRKVYSVRRNKLARMLGNGHTEQFPVYGVGFNPHVVYKRLYNSAVYTITEYRFGLSILLGFVLIITSLLWFIFNALHLEGAFRITSMIFVVNAILMVINRFGYLDLRFYFRMILTEEYKRLANDTYPGFVDQVMDMGRRYKHDPAARLVHAVLVQQRGRESRRKWK